MRDVLRSAWLEEELTVRAGTVNSSICPVKLSSWRVNEVEEREAPARAVISSWMRVIWAKIVICKLWAVNRADWRRLIIAGEGRATISIWRMLCEIVMMSVVITPEDSNAVNWEISRAKLIPTEESVSVSVKARTVVSLDRT